MAQDAVTAAVWQGGSAICFARVYKLVSNNKTAAVQADYTSITRYVYHEGKTLAATTSLTIANVAFNTLQTGDVWTDEVDATGFNIKDIIEATVFTSPGLWVIRHKYVFTDSYTIWAEFRCDVQRTS